MLHDLSTMGQRASLEENGNFSLSINCRKERSKKEPRSRSIPRIWKTSSFEGRWKEEVHRESETIYT